MNSNTKLEIAVEIIANKIAKSAKANDEKIDHFIQEQKKSLKSIQKNI